MMLIHMSGAAEWASNTFDRHQHPSAYAFHSTGVLYNILQCMVHPDRDCVHPCLLAELSAHYSMHEIFWACHTIPATWYTKYLCVFQLIACLLVCLPSSDRPLAVLKLALNKIFIRNHNVIQQPNI